VLSSKKNDLRRLTKDVSIHSCLYATKSNCWKPVKLLYKMSKVFYKCKKEKVLEEFNKNKLILMDTKQFAKADCGSEKNWGMVIIQ
jgi:hypothetical protein